MAPAVRTVGIHRHAHQAIPWARSGCSSTLHRLHRVYQKTTALDDGMATAQLRGGDADEQRWTA